MQVYDRIPIWVSYLFMMLIGGTVLRLLIGPALGVVYFALRLV